MEVPDLVPDLKVPDLEVPDLVVPDLEVPGRVPDQGGSWLVLNSSLFLNQDCIDLQIDILTNLS